MKISQVSFTVKCKFVALAKSLAKSKNLKQTQTLILVTFLQSAEVAQLEHFIVMFSRIRYTIVSL